MPPDAAACPYCESPISATAKKCRHCGEWIRNECRVCGTELGGRWARQGLCAEHERSETAPQQKVVVVENEESGGSVLAAIASFLIPGLGQLGQGRLGAAIGHFFMAMILWVVFLGWIIHLVSAINAANYRRTKAMKHQSFRLT